jgi:hypothetical protein
MLSFGVLMAATLATAIALAGAPSWQNLATDVCLLAGVLAAATMTLLWITRFLGAAGRRIERAWLAAFLAGMPLVYLASWLVHDGHNRLWLGIETLALPVFVLLAVLALKRSPWYLAGGLLAHGLLWDAWHLSGLVVPAWYARGCLLVDVALGAYVISRIGD